MPIRTVQDSKDLPTYWVKGGQESLYPEARTRLEEVLSDNGLPPNLRLIGGVTRVRAVDPGLYAYEVYLDDPVLRWLFAVSLEMREEPFGPVLDALVTRRAAEVLR